MNFVTLDFETATSKRDSPCELGITFVENGNIKETKSWLIKPRNNHFDSFNTFIHGISAKDVENEPEFSEIWDEIKNLIEGKMVFAHNAAFDFSVLRNTLESYHIPLPNLEYACSYKIAKKVWPQRPSYDLKSLCRFNQISFTHHRAAEDSMATAHLVLRAFENAGINNIHEIQNKLQLKLGQISDIGYKPCENIRVRTKNPLPQTTSDISKHNFDSIFYDKTVVFTGTLSSMVRSDAQKLIAEIGGKNSNTINMSTDYLIVGQQDFRVVGDDGMSKKQEKAICLIEKGSQIEILSEADFLKNI